MVRPRDQNVPGKNGKASVAGCTQVCNQLGTPGGATSFLTGAQSF